MQSKILAALSDRGIEAGNTIPNKVRSVIRQELATDTSEGWEKFHKAWYAVTNDRAGFGPETLIRTK